MISKVPYHLIRCLPFVDQPKKRGWSSNYCKHRDSSCFGILRWSIWRTELVISFLGQNWTQNCQNSLKSISRESLVVESWLTPQNDRQKGREGRDSKISISWELNIIAIKLADLSKCAKDIFLLVFITIYDSSTKGNGLKTRNLP